MNDPTKLREKFREQSTKNFQDFLESPPIKLLLSMIPAANPPETVVTVLRQAWDAGEANGLMYAAVQILEQQIRNKNRD